MGGGAGGRPAARSDRPGPRHVDIALPVYNGAQFLASTLDSLLGQTHRDFEIWISDNASTDATPGIAERYVELDRRIHYERHAENRGAAWNFNQARKFASGPYFKWSAHDDVYEPAYLERCIGALEAEPDAVVAQPRTIFIDADGHELLRSFRVNDWGEPSPAARLRSVLSRNHEYAFAFGVLRRSILCRLAPYLARYGADELLLAELALLGRFAEVDEHLFCNRLHTGRSMVQNSGLRYRLLWHGWWTGTSGEGGPLFPAWRFLVDLSDVVRRVPMARNDRRACSLVVVRWTRDNWSRLGLDIPLGIESWIHRRSAR